MTARRIFDSLPIIVAASLLLLFHIYNGTGTGYTGDALSKLVQAKGLLESGYESEELYYPGRSIDPDYDYYPFDEGIYHIEVNGQQIGQYPVVFTAIAAVFLWIGGPHLLTILTGIAVVATLAVFQFFWKPQRFTMWLACLGTYILYQGILFTENAPYLLLTFLGFSLLVLPSERWYRPVLGGALLGIATAMRLESIVLAAAIGLAVVFVHGWKYATRRAFIGAALAFGVCVGSLFVFHLIHYGHALGPRYIVNPHEDASLWSRLEIIRGLLFFADWRPGFFLYIPLFLVASGAGFLPRIRSEWSRQTRLAWATSVIFIVVAVLAAPNDGIADWGPRFLLAAVLPLTIVLDALWKQYRDWSPIRWAMLILLVYSILITVFGTFAYSAAAQILKRAQSQIAREESQVWIFGSHASAHYSGLHYFDRQVFTVRSAEEAMDLTQRLVDTGVKEAIFIMIPVLDCAGDPSCADIQKIRSGIHEHMQLQSEHGQDLHIYSYTVN